MQIMTYGNVNFECMTVRHIKCSPQWVHPLFCAQKAGSQPNEWSSGRGGEYIIALKFYSYA